MQSAKEILNDLRPVNPDNDDWIIAAMHVYAAQAITAQLEVAAQEAETQDRIIKIDGINVFAGEEVNRESITSCTRIELH